MREVDRLELEERDQLVDERVLARVAHPTELGLEVLHSRRDDRLEPTADPVGHLDESNAPAAP